MRVLALDTTTRAGSVAIVDDDRVLIERRADQERSHAERLPNDLTNALNACGLTAADIDVFAVAVGPGSFTGLRIGIATIQGAAFVTGKRVVPISALTALGEAGSAGLEAGTLVGAWMDAHRRDVFSALFQVGAGRRFTEEHLVEIDPPAVDDPHATWDRWRTLAGSPEVLIGDGATLFAEVATGARVLELPALAAVIARLAYASALAGRTVDPAGIQPLYIRRPDAEIAREKVL